MIRTIIIDDEISATNVLAMLLKKKCRDYLEVIACTSSPAEGRDLIERHRPDLVFLDIEMPGMTGIDLVRSFENPGFRVIFVTAYDAYAVEAFRLSAVDYLLKPVETADLLRAVEKIRQDMLLNRNSLGAQLQQLEKWLRPGHAVHDNKVGIGMADKIIFITISDILYCEANGSYTYVFLNDGQKIVASRQLGDFEQQLATHGFFRIHHSHLINLGKIKEFQRHDGGYVILDNGKELEVSQRKRKDFLDAINDFMV